MMEEGQEWDPDVIRGTLDELFRVARQYRTSKSYHELLAFIARFRAYAPFNAMLLHVQMPGATYVAPAKRWLRDYGRLIKPHARPLVILQPMGPVMFVFDVTSTEPMDGAPSLPAGFERPFEVRKGRIGNQLGRSIENAKRDGIEICERDAGSQSAGEIRSAPAGKHLQVVVKQEPDPVYVRVLRRYELLLNGNQSAEARYATLAHELGHLYCGHLGTSNSRWWPDRRGLSHELREFEAESVCYLVCSRLGLDNPSDEYLASFVQENDQTPLISIDCVMRAAWLIEKMGRKRLKPRKEAS